MHLQPTDVHRGATCPLVLEEESIKEGVGELMLLERGGLAEPRLEGRVLSFALLLGDGPNTRFLNKDGLAGTVGVHFRGRLPGGLTSGIECAGEVELFKQASAARGNPVGAEAPPC